MRTTLNDLRYAARQLARQRLFTLVALATLALGIGANSAIFAVVDAVMLRPLPYREPGRLVLIEELIRKLGPQGLPVTPQDMVEFQRNTTAFDEVAAFTATSMELTGAGQPERLEGLRVSPEIFQALGVTLSAGRGFAPEEDRPDSGVAVISYRLWQRRFAGASGAVGRVVNFNRKPVTIVGVLPKDFEFPLPGIIFGGGKDVWMPLGLTPQEIATIGNYNYALIGRMKPDVTLSGAQADVQAVARRMYEKLPPRIQAEFTLDAQVTPVTVSVVRDSRKLLWLLAGAVGFVLLIACVNVANLLLTRAANRQQELAIRASLGASRTRLIRHLLTESLLLSTVGGGGSLLLAMWLVGWLARVMPASIPRVSTIALDWHVVAFTTAVSVLSGLLFGTMPALSAVARLKGAVRGATQNVAHARLRGLLVVSEVALSLVLLVGAGLLVRSLVALRSVDPGFDVQHILTARVTLPASAYRDAASIRGFYQRAVDALAALPGASATGAATTPFLNLRGQNLFTVKTAGFPQSLSSHAQVAGNYFQAAGIPLRRGRIFDSRDRAESEPVIVINETLARTYFPGRDPVGQQIKLGSRETPDPWLTVIGVVADVKNNELANAVRPQTYVAYAQVNDRILTGFFSSMVLTVKAAAEPAALTSAVRAAIARLDPELPVTDLQTMRAQVERSLSPQWFQTGLVGSFAGLALLLAAIGIYGVVSYAVTQRTREIGVRMALGASRGNVLKLVIGQSMKFVVAGVVLGLGASVALTRVMTSFLFGVTATDALTFVLAPAVLCVVALIANLAPARRASGVDPVVALRYE